MRFLILVQSAKQQRNSPSFLLATGGHFIGPIYLSQSHALSRCHLFVGNRRRLDTLTFAIERAEEVCSQEMAKFRMNGFSINDVLNSWDKSQNNSHHNSQDNFQYNLRKKYLCMFILTLIGMTLKITIKHEAGHFYPPQSLMNTKYFPNFLVTPHGLMDKAVVSGLIGQEFKSWCRQESFFPLSL